jgi:hypothetical protein
MIKFFRKIRQNLLMENKTGKYFKYAIGEIILVVIGILIALSINNWNDKRKANDIMISFLQEIKLELGKDTLGMNKDIKRYETYFNFKDSLTRLTDYSAIPTRKLLSIIRTKANTFKPSRITFQKITNLGINKISNSDSLSNMIYSYYLETLTYFKTIQNWDDDSTLKDDDYWFKNQNQFEIKYRRNFTKLQDEKNRLGLINIISEPRGRNIIVSDLIRKKLVLSLLAKNKQKASELILQIEKELK